MIVIKLDGASTELVFVMHNILVTLVKFMNRLFAFLFCVLWIVLTVAWVNVHKYQQVTEIIHLVSAMLIVLVSVYQLVKLTVQSLQHRKQKKKKCD